MPSAPVAIITAASKGMGAACARLLAQRGYHLALFARGPELGNLATELDALAVTGDLADSAAIERSSTRPISGMAGSTRLSITPGTRPKATS